MKNKALFLNCIVCFFLFFGLDISVKAQSLSDYRWTLIDAKGENEVTGRHEDTFIAYRDKFYLMGGRGVNPVNVFDPKTNSWEVKGKSPMEIHHFQAVLVDDAFYLMGAMTGKYPLETPLENIWIYYPEKDVWEKGPEIPVQFQRGGAGAVVYNDKIYQVGGIRLGHTSGTTNLFNSFSLKTGEWEQLTDAPHIRDHFPAIVVDNKLYCVGGRNTSVHYPSDFGAFFSAVEPAVDVYDFSNGKWSTLEEEIPYPSAAGALVKINKKLIYIGGECSWPNASSQTQCLDLETGKWEQLAPLVIGRHGSGAILYKNDLYIAAGSPNRGGGNMSSIEVFSAKHEWEKLFNGQNLDGWEVKCVEQDKAKNYWTVDDGAILCNTKGNNEHQYMWLQSVDEFGDFELRLKFQATGENKGNAGVQVRSRYDETAKIDGEFVGWLDGPQIDIEPNNPWRNGFIYDETRTARRWISPSLPDWKISKEEYAPKKVFYFNENEGTGWNDVRIVCKGMRIKTFVNNLLVADYDGTGVLDDEGHKKYNVSEKGHIALQLHKNANNYIRFKDIEIREIN
jgi:N-acetylneuraminic acid mutarotase